MNNTGVVRKIDELGRIVIPKEIRKSLNIRNGEDVQIYLDNENIVLKKYEKLLNISDKAQKAIDTFIGLTNFNIIIVDLNRIIASNNKSIIDKKYNCKVFDLINSRQSSLYHGEIYDNCIYSAYLCPIIIDADLIGSIIIYGNDKISDKEKMLVNVIKLIITDLFY